MSSCMLGASALACLSRRAARISSARLVDVERAPGVRGGDAPRGTSASFGLGVASGVKVAYGGRVTASRSGGRMSGGARLFRLLVADVTAVVKPMANEAAESTAVLGLVSDERRGRPVLSRSRPVAATSSSVSACCIGPMSSGVFADSNSASSSSWSLSFLSSSSTSLPSPGGPTSLPSDTSSYSIVGGVFVSSMLSSISL